MSRPVRVAQHLRRRVRSSPLAVSGVEVHDYFTPSEMDMWPRSQMMYVDPPNRELGAVAPEGMRTFVVRDQNGKVIGALQAYQHMGSPFRFTKSLFGDDYPIKDSPTRLVFIQGLETYVRDKGHGRKLVQAAEAWARSHNVNIIILEPTLDSFEFWRHMGYRSIVPKGSFGSVVMIKRLSRG